MSQFLKSFFVILFRCEVNTLLKEFVPGISVGVTISSVCKFEAKKGEVLPFFKFCALFGSKLHRVHDIFSSAPIKQKFSGALDNFYT